MTPEARRDYDRALGQLPSAVPGERTTPKRRRVPSWYKGEAGAASSSMLAAQQLGLRPAG